MINAEYERSLRTAVINACQRMVSSKLVYGTAGNVSIRVGDRILISPSSVPYSELTPELICEVGLDGSVPAGQRAKASSEVPLHLELYRNSDAAAVVHAHSAAAVAAGLVTDEIPAIHYMIRQFGGPVRVADYATFGSADLASLVSQAIHGRTAALMRSHGLVVYAADLGAALAGCEQLEWLCDVYLRARAAGPIIATLDTDELTVVADAATQRGYRL
ncbi:class II aldolase/adducin family protein [Microterricola pindariensis]|uniref:Class II aldolase/adducin N-terminal domain-containing protein n=1 Tax=Microterricola pindariensis TaxID=478010 RepID=A0ABX5B0R9_9MICO|nr:class II aldolase/adducin family protein [Microterricola pindariensis]PPL20226.1 hypothetical protein GY24_01385 [Microterricola pindariensis]